MAKLRAFASLASLPEAADELLLAAQQRSPFLGRDWFEVYTSQVRTTHRSPKFFVLAAPGEGLPGVVLPAWERESRNPLVGRSLRALSNFYSPTFEPAFDRSSPKWPSAVSHLIRELVSATPPWDSIGLAPLPLHEPIFEALHQAFQHCGWPLQRYFCFGNWYLPVKSRSFSQYMTERPSSLRNTLRRKTQGFERNEPLHLSVASTGMELTRAMDAFELVYGASWKPDERFPNFVRQLALSFEKPGWSRIGILRAGERPVAAQFWIVANRTASIYKLAHDQRYAAFSPGTLLTAHMMEHVFSVDQVLEVDFLAGDEEYKKLWMTDRREFWGLLAFNPRTAAGRLQSLRHIQGRALKRLFVHRPHRPKWLRFD